MTDFCSLTIHESSALLATGKTTSLELTEQYLRRIEVFDGDLNSFITVDRDGAVKSAKEADERLAKGETGRLLGIPVALKDLINSKGLPTTCASKMLENFVSPYDAFVAGRLKSEGAVILGKTNMDQFAMGSSNETSYFGAVKNPWDQSKIPGGSSGGSAVAVSADLCCASLGSDTGGSIRQPAALCGMVGLKPTYGRVSRFGLVAFASSLDQIGPMTKDVRDCAIMLGAISGHDPMDSTSADRPVDDYLVDIDKGVEGLKIGIPKEYFVDGTESSVRSAVESAIKKLEEKGAIISEISLPHTDYGVPTYYVLAPAEASSNLSRYDAVKYGYRTENAGSLMEMYLKSRSEGFGDEVKRRIMLGTYALSSGYYDAYYLKAQKVRTLIKKDFLSAFEKVDIIATPTTPAPAFAIGEKSDDPLTMYLSDIFTINANLAGIPGLSLPCGFSDENLPLGIQLMGSHFSEAALLRCAMAIEKSVEVQNRKPALTS
jgi:aspartyl-tRNA(Asn)/glutamyl-tRNA(Gln) amidotransferase subunit A